MCNGNLEPRDPKLSTPAVGHQEIPWVLEFIATGFCGETIQAIKGQPITKFNHYYYIFNY